MNQLIRPTEIQNLIQQGRHERMQYLFETDISFIANISKPYPFLLQILKQTRKCILS